MAGETATNFPSTPVYGIFLTSGQMGAPPMATYTGTLTGSGHLVGSAVVNLSATDYAVEKIVIAADGSYSGTLQQDITVTAIIMEAGHTITQTETQVLTNTVNGNVSTPLTLTETVLGQTITVTSQFVNHSEIQIQGTGNINEDGVSGPFSIGGTLTNPYKTLNDPLGVNGTGAIGINDNGQIVGYYLDNGKSYNGFLNSAGNYTTIDDPLGVNGTFANGVNDNAQIVGTYVTNQIANSTLVEQGFLDSNGIFTTISDPLGISTQVNGINIHGKIVGDYFDSSGLEHGFIFKNGAYTTLDDPVGAKGTVAVGINDSAQIVGYFINSKGIERGFLYSNGVFTTINDPLGVNGTVVNGINNAGEIVGGYQDAKGVMHGFLYSNGVFTNINDPFGANGTEAYGITSAGQIVGVYWSGNHVVHGFHLI